MPVTNGGGGVPAGSVQHFAMSAPPAGWLKANGAAVSRQMYAGLFLAIGTTYGAGDGATTFNVPDLRGEFLRGFDDGRGVDVGRGFATAQMDSFGKHSHGMMSVSGADIGGASISNPATTAMQDYKTGEEGGAETRPRNVAMLACIKF